MINCFYDCRSNQRKPLIEMKKYCSYFMLLFAIASCSDWVMPKELAGRWTGNEIITLRFDAKGKPYAFVKSKDSLPVIFIINNDGTVEGTFGNAKLTGCRVNKNRNAIGRALNLATDFVITGNLTGPVFQEDTIVFRNISAPFDMKNNTISGSIFQRDGLDLFPMAGLNLTKE